MSWRGVAQMLMEHSPLPRRGEGQGEGAGATGRRQHPPSRVQGARFTAGMWRVLARSGRGQTSAPIKWARPAVDDGLWPPWSTPLPSALRSGRRDPMAPISAACELKSLRHRLSVLPWRACALPRCCWRCSFMPHTPRPHPTTGRRSASRVASPAARCIGASSMGSSARSGTVSRSRNTRRCAPGRSAVFGGECARGLDLER